MPRSLARGARRNAHSAIIVALALTLVGCAGRPGPEVLVPVATAPGTKSVSIYVATARKRGTPSENVFTAERANTLNFAKFTIAIPPNHQSGNIEWPEGAPDPRASFATIDQALLNDAEFRKAVAPSPKSSGFLAYKWIFTTSRGLKPISNTCWRLLTHTPILKVG